MARPKAKAPARRYHLSGQSVVTICGRDFYLGEHDSPESIARYAALIAVYRRLELALPDRFDLAELDPIIAMIIGEPLGPIHQADKPILVRHVTASYREFAKTKFAESMAELERARKVCDALEKHDGDALANEYGPLRSQAQRQRWIDDGLARVWIANCKMNIAKRKL